VAGEVGQVRDEIMPGAERGHLAAVITELGHAVLLCIVAGAILAGRVKGVERSAANVAVAAGMLVAAALLLLEAMGLLRGRWSHAGWVVLAAATGAFVWINIL
jgi:hypothetical protein